MPMNLSNTADRFLGQWLGTKELYLTGPPEPDSVSVSELVVVPAAKGKFLAFSYTWEFKEASHEGFLLVGNGSAEKGATVAWVDSFHMSGKIMLSEGSVDEIGRVNVLGYYEAPPDPDWGWRTQVESDGEELHIIMQNISPDGKELLAVKAAYERA